MGGGDRRIPDSVEGCTPEWIGVGWQESCQTKTGTGVDARKLTTYIQVR